MASRGFLIRFIDIGLIVLFGFLMISDIEAATRVELAGSERPVEEPPQPEEDETGYVVVEVAADGAFVVGPRGTSLGGESLGEPGGAGEAGGEAATVGRVRVSGVVGLQEAVGRLADAYAAAGLETVVVIEPHPASAVQRTVDVMDVSDRLGLQKTLRMDLDMVAPDSAAAPDSVAAPDSTTAGGLAP